MVVRLCDCVANSDCKRIADFAERVCATTLFVFDLKRTNAPIVLFYYFLRKGGEHSVAICA